MSSRKRKTAHIIGESKRQTTRSSRRRSTSILEFPNHVSVEILSKLPIKTLIRCRCVCKTWKTLLSDPHFIKLQLSTTPFNLLYKTNPPRRGSSQLHMTDLRISNISCSRDSKLKLTLKVNLPSNSNSNGDGPITLLNSCNGLLCLGDYITREPLYVCNPILGEYITLSKPHKGIRSFSGSGIGFCSETNQYKVLRYLYPLRGDAPPQGGAEIYTLGEGKWRSIGKAPDGYDFYSSSNAYVNGALHWVNIGAKHDYLQSFHFGSEQFRVIPPPADFVPVFYRNKLRFGELHGCLYLTDNILYSSNLEIWVMNNYGVQESWSKKFIIIKNYIPKSGYHDIFEPILVLDNGEILFIFNDRSIILCNPHSETYRYLDQTCGIRSVIQAIVHLPSFLSLKGVTSGEIMQVCRA